MATYIKSKPVDSLVLIVEPCPEAVVIDFLLFKNLSSIRKVLFTGLIFNPEQSIPIGPLEDWVSKITSQFFNSLSLL